EVQLVEQVCGKGLELLGGLHQPAQHGMGVDLENARRASDAQAFSQTRDDPHDQLFRGALPIKERPVRRREIALAGDTLQLTPGLSTGMSVGAAVAASAPAVIGASVIRTAMRSSVDGAPASSGEGEHRRGRARRLGWCIGALLTRFAERLVDQLGEGSGYWGARASRLVRLRGDLGAGAEIGAPA